MPRSCSAVITAAGVLAGEHLAEQPVADLPHLQGVETDRDRVAQLVGLEAAC